MWKPAERMALTKPALTVDGVIPVTMIGGLPKSCEKGVSIWVAPSLEEGSQNSGLNLRGKESIPGLHQTWCPLLALPILVLGVIQIIQLITFGLVSENDNADAPSAQNTRQLDQPHQPHLDQNQSCVWRSLGNQWPWSSAVEA